MSNAPYIIQAAVPDHAPQALKDLIQKWLDAANATVEFVSNPESGQVENDAAFDMALYATTAVFAPLISHAGISRDGLTRQFREAIEEQIKAFSTATRLKAN